MSARMQMTVEEMDILEKGMEKIFIGSGVDPFFNDAGREMRFCVDIPEPTWFILTKLTNRGRTWYSINLSVYGETVREDEDLSRLVSEYMTYCNAKVAAGRLK